MITSRIKCTYVSMFWSQKSDNASILRRIGKLFHVHQVGIALFKDILKISSILHLILKEDLELNALLDQDIHDVVDEVMLYNVWLLFENVVKQMLSWHLQDWLIFHFFLLTFSFSCCNTLFMEILNICFIDFFIIFINYFSTFTTCKCFIFINVSSIKFCFMVIWAEILFNRFLITIINCFVKPFDWVILFIQVV